MKSQGCFQMKTSKWYNFHLYGCTPKKTTIFKRLLEVEVSELLLRQFIEIQEKLMLLNILLALLLISTLQKQF